MKTAAKVFIIISMVCTFWTIVSIVFGVIALKKLKEAKKKEDIPMWVSICTLLLCSPIGGILMLCLKDEHLAPVAADDNGTAA